MRFWKSGRGFWMLLAAWALLLFSGCRAAPAELLSYRQGDFCATVTWQEGERNFCCRAEYRQGSLLRAEYTSPAALRGVILEPSGERCRILRGAAEEGAAMLEKELPQEQLRGLLLPARLPLLPGAELLSAQKLAQGSQLQLHCPEAGGDISLTLTEGELPSMIATSRQTYCISVTRAQKSSSDAT